MRNLLRADLGRWWKTRTWWMQSLMWVGIINLVLFTLILAERAEGGVRLTDELVALYSVFGGLFVLVGVVIIMQDAIVGEKETGTAAWVLSKPVSRAAFVISKLTANALGIAVSAVFFPGAIAYLLITKVAGLDVGVINFLGGMGILFLSALFWLVFTLMLGAFYNSRGPVIGFPLGLVFGQQFIIGLVLQYIPWLYDFLPYQLVLPLNGSDTSSVVGAVISGNTPPSWVPVYSAVIFIVLFTAVGIWRFSREEL